MSAITSLTPHGVKIMCEAQNPAAELRNQWFVLQAIDVKLFS